MGNQNITLSLPEEDIREARILAASRGTSVSQLLAPGEAQELVMPDGYKRSVAAWFTRLDGRAVS